ncbi:MAG: sugar phosphate isomerase/epimerase family protein [Fimbriimonas sp.]
MNAKSLNYWSAPNGLSGTVPISDFLALAVRHRFEAVELCIFEEGVLHLGTTESEARAIRTQVEDAGLVVPSTASGIYWSRSLGDPGEGVRAQAFDDLKRMLEISSWLGAKTHLTIPGAVSVFFLPDRPVQRYDEVYQRAQDGLAALAPLAEDAGVTMAIENVWNMFLLSPVEMVNFIDGIGSKFVGSYFDVGNILPYGYPQDWLRILGHRVAGVHFKDFRKSVGTENGFVDLLEGDVDFPAVMAAIQEIGYTGPVVAEMIPNYALYPEVRVANTSNAMDAILGRK